MNRSEFHKQTDPQLFLSNGNLTSIVISNISTCGETISFNVCFNDGIDIVYNNTNDLPQTTTATNNIITQGNVIVDNNDNITFEAGSSVILNDGFEVKANGTFMVEQWICQYFL